MIRYRPAMRMASGIVMLVPALAAGQETEARLSLLEAVERALAVSPALDAGRAGVRGARAESDIAKAARLPRVSAEATATRFGEPMIVAPLHGFDPGALPLFDRTLLQGYVAVGYTAWDGGARGARIAAALAEADAAAANAETVRSRVIAETVGAYLEVQSAAQVVAAQDARMAAVERERERAQRFEGAGRAARVDVLRAEAAAARSRAERIDAVASLRAAERALARLLGADGALGMAGVAPVTAAPGGLPERAALLEQAGAANTELRRLSAQVAARRALLAEARSQWWPRVQLSGRWVEYASADGHESAEWQGGVALSYPIFTGGARSAGIERADAGAALAEARLREAELRVGDAIDRTLAALESARARSTALEAAVAQAGEVARIERLSLDAGAGTQSDYLLAEAELLEVRTALVQARHLEVVARVELARLTGRLTADWIAENLEPGP